MLKTWVFFVDLLLKGNSTLSSGRIVKIPLVFDESVLVPLVLRTRGIKTLSSNTPGPATLTKNWGAKTYDKKMGGKHYLTRFSPQHYWKTKYTFDDELKSEGGATPPGPPASEALHLGYFSLILLGGVSYTNCNSTEDKTYVFLPD